MDSGLLAAAAGVAGKLTFSNLYVPEEFDGVAVGYVIGKILLLATMVSLNSLMISRYVRALETSDSTLRVQVVNFATNFLSSVVFSLLVFGEGWSQVQQPSWWLGATAMVLGVFVILGGKQKTT